MPPNPSEKSAARGRALASKPLAASASTPKVASSSRTPSAASSASSTRKPTEKTPSSSRASSRGGSESGFKVTKLSSTTVTLNTTWTPKPLQPASTSASAPAPVSVAEEHPARTSDPLQVAAQAYPWAYMSSTLDACFNTAEETAKKELETLSKEINEEESELSEQRDRVEAERALGFFEELGSGAFATDAPEIMKLFHSHGEASAQIEKDALQLAMKSSPDPEDEEPLKAYNDMLDALEKLRSEAVTLQDSIIKLTEAPPSEDATKSASTDASEARSQELIDTALENISLGLRMESMGIS